MERLWIVLLAILLSACSLGRKTAYRFADTWLLREMDETFDLTTDQKRQSEAALERIFAWHRKEELPRVATLFRAAARDAEDGVSPAEVDQYLDALSERYAAVVKALAPDAGTLLASLSDTQISHMEKETEESQNKRFKHFTKSESEAVERLARRMQEGLERWVDDLTPPQEALVEKYALTIFPLERARRNALPARNRAFAELLRSRPGAAELARQLEVRTLSPRAAGEAAFADISDQIDRFRRTLYKDVLTNLTPAQRSALRGNLEGWARDAEELATE